MSVFSPGFPTFGSPDHTIANRSPFGSHEKSKTASGDECKLISDETSVHGQTLVFDNFDGEIHVPRPEGLEITEYRFLRLCVTADLHTEEVDLVLPAQFTLKKA